MTARQEAYHLISKLPDDTVMYLVELLRRMPSSPVKSSGSEVPVRFGLGKGIITDPADFDLWDEEITDLFEGDVI